jgi:hypothetical protein
LNDGNRAVMSTGVNVRRCLRVRVVVAVVIGCLRSGPVAIHLA